MSGGKESIIEVRQPGKPPEENAEALLLGHASNVCALDVSSEGGWVVSGSWDASARVWRVGKWECDALLEGHEGSVWDVLAYDRDTIITGWSNWIMCFGNAFTDFLSSTACADKFIRVFSPAGNLLHTIKGNTDVVRALCRVPKCHPSKADFASASNDGIIRLWRLNGRQVGELLGHESFIYSLASLPTGELVSSGEDRTVRIWRGNECVQTITHPAISVWGVAVCSENGDIVSGASDRIVRIFSREKERQAEPQVLQAFENSVKSSSIPQQAVGEVNKEKLPGPEFLLQKSGTKEGQVVMIREADGSVTAHQWSQGAQLWMNVGTVVDAVGSSGKKKGYLGKDYDYVFDVDIEDGKPPLKLPFNLSQNPYEAATKFIQDNELPMTYLDQVAGFITTNTQGATLGQTSSQPAPAGADPWGTESRYRPGETASPASQSAPATPRPNVLPQMTYLTILTANLATIHKKIVELNTTLITTSKHLSLNPSQLELLATLTTHLEHHPPATALTPAPTPLITAGFDLVLQIATTWPPPSRLPALDLLRLLAACTPYAATYSTPPSSSSSSTLIDALASSGVFAEPARPNNTMLATRTLANLFAHAPGRDLAAARFQQIAGLVKTATAGAGGNRNLLIAVMTVWINYAVLLTKVAPAKEEEERQRVERALVLLDAVTGILRAATDSEVVYRGLVALGTVLRVGGEEVTGAGREVFGVREVVERAERVVREPRVGGVVKEIRGGLV